MPLLHTLHFPQINAAAPKEVKTLQQKLQDDSQNIHMLWQHPRYTSVPKYLMIYHLWV